MTLHASGMQYFTIWYALNHIQSYLFFIEFQRVATITLSLFSLSWVSSSLTLFDWALYEVLVPKMDICSTSAMELQNLVTIIVQPTMFQFLRPAWLAILWSGLGAAQFHISRHAHAHCVKATKENSVYNFVWCNLMELCELRRSQTPTDYAARLVACADILSTWHKPFKKWGSMEPMEPPLDPPLCSYMLVGTEAPNNHLHCTLYQVSLLDT